MIIVTQLDHDSSALNSTANSNRNTFDKLLVSLQAGINTLQLFIGICDADRQREQLIEKFSLFLAPEIYTYRVQLDSQEPSLRLAVEQQVTNRQQAIAMVVGIKSLGLAKDDLTLDCFFGYLQWTREGMRVLNMLIVLWIPSRIHALISRKALDFYS